MPLLLATAAAVAFVAAAVPGLTEQGMYYDELHQATGAFAYVGQDPELFSIGSVFGLPVLNTSYSGAIKTGIYGLYLRLGSDGFTVRSWRLLGIVTVALGLAVFIVLAHRALGSAACLLFALLMISDATVLLTTRHDWGPVALALALRLLLLGVWLSSSEEEASTPAGRRNSAVLGLLFGLALFEKLSSLVLIVPLGLILVQRCRTGSTRHLRWAAAGLAIGGAPLLLANLGSLARTGAVISLAQVGDGVATPSLSGLLVPYLDLARGAEAQQLILGRAVGDGALQTQLAVLALASTAILVLLERRRHAAFARSLTLVVSYLGIAVALHLLPNKTWIHHWVLGIPFQYLAFALAVTGISRTWAAPGRRALAMATVTMLGLLLFARVPGFVALERSLIQGESSAHWDPSLTELGRFAEQHDDALFIASSWGVATQIYCLAQGRPGVVREIFRLYKGPAELARTAADGGKDTFYLVSTSPPPSVWRESFDRIEADAGRLEGWREVAPESTARSLEAVSVRKFVRSDGLLGLGGLRDHRLAQPSNHADDDDGTHQ